MTDALTQIETRKQALIAESDAQRELLAAAWHGLERPIGLCYKTADTLRSPWLWGAVGLVTLKLPKKKLLRVPVLLWKGYRLAQRVRSYIR